MVKVSPKYQEIIKHMLAMNSKRRQEWGSRNYFAVYASSDDYVLLRSMESLGLVRLTQTSQNGLHYFAATEQGLAAVGMRRAHNGYLIPIDEVPA